MTQMGPAFFMGETYDLDVVKLAEGVLMAALRDALLITRRDEVRRWLASPTGLTYVKLAGWDTGHISRACADDTLWEVVIATMRHALEADEDGKQRSNLIRTSHLPERPRPAFEAPTTSWEKTIKAGRRRERERNNGAYQYNRSEAVLAQAGGNPG